MLADHDIVCFSSDWSGDPTSKRHIMTRLARDSRVLWVDSIGYRRPRASGRDLRRLLRKAGDVCRGCRRVAPNIWALTPPVLPLHDSPSARRLNRRLLATSLRGAARRLGFRELVAWSFLPSSAVVAGELGERLLVYHCVDEFTGFTGVDRASLAALEAELAGRADLVVVSAERLLESKRRLNPNVHLVRHGVDLEHFGAALAPETVVPADLGPASGPTIGFFGLVADWVDLEVVAHLARARPDWRLVLVGPVDTDLGALAGLPNVRLLGRRPYASLPAYCKGFDVALLPFRTSELTLAANPLKLREYLAAGLPVVSSALPEVARFAPPVRLARTPEEFLRAVEAVLASGETGPRREIAAGMADEGWDARAAELSALVSAALAGSGRTAARRAS